MTRTTAPVSERLVRAIQDELPAFAPSDELQRDEDLHVAAEVSRRFLADQIISYGGAIQNVCVTRKHPGSTQPSGERPGGACQRCRTKIKAINEAAGVIAPDKP